MNAFKILIVENNDSHAQTLRQYLRDLNYRIVGMAQTYMEAKQLYLEFQPDLTLMDIHLKSGLEGISLARFIRSQHQTKPFIYLCSQLDNQALQLSKQTFPAAYLGKPIRKELLQATIEVAIQNNKAPKQAVLKITVSEGGYKHVLSIQDILFLQADHIYVQVHCCGGKKIIHRGSLSDLLKKLPAEQFVKTHRSYVINLDRVSTWTQQYVYVQDEAIPLSRSCRKMVLSKLGKEDPSGMRARG